jgi:ethanolamine utilization protein EutA
VHGGDRHHGHLHTGGGDHGHDHKHDDHGHDDEEWSDALILADNVELLSVGIDVGSSTTQVVFSRLHLQRQGGELVDRFVVVERESLYRSPVALTPFLGVRTIDADAVGAIVDKAYAEAAIDPGQVDTGAVILTGEAMRRDNAAALSAALSVTAGNFVCATAGHRMEATIAAYGSGAVRMSERSEGAILNVDIGGGTTKFALLESGVVHGVAALHVGGRLAVVADDDRLIRLEPAGQLIAQYLGFDWHLGDRVEPAEFVRLSQTMAQLIASAMCGNRIPSELADLELTEPLVIDRPLRGVVFSGGVSEYVYGHETRSFGDLGLALGASIAQVIDSNTSGWALIEPDERIRATVIGSSEHTVQLSGVTCDLVEAQRILPIRNLRVLRPTVELAESIDASAVARSIARAVNDEQLEETEEPVAWGIAWSGDPSYARLSALANGIAEGVRGRVALGHPTIVIMDGDVARTLGSLLRDECLLASGVLVLDGIALADFDYVDLSVVRFPSNTVQVTIKSLVFAMRKQSGE